MTSISATCTGGTQLPAVTVPSVSAEYTITPGYNTTLSNELAGLELVMSAGALDDYDFAEFEQEIGSNITADSVGFHAAFYMYAQLFLSALSCQRACMQSFRW